MGTLATTTNTNVAPVAAAVATGPSTLTQPVTVARQ